MPLRLELLGFLSVSFHEALPHFVNGTLHLCLNLPNTPRCCDPTQSSIRP